MIDTLILILSSSFPLPFSFFGSLSLSLSSQRFISILNLLQRTNQPTPFPDPPSFNLPFQPRRNPNQKGQNTKIIPRSPPSSPIPPPPPPPPPLP
ncbi:hypothetical protein IE53DRAFT_5280 [Violaceomyces palustris]|uniref:Uncharacterized protein n=1 Tax=Violaceomyces palustris TaxID=1673888 RepID=A0ACD0NM12_9BASI|nr:hypothetical protein IE53DRAFT_5280 [Violaceomyces palustris]